ncbi:MAG: anthranilate synthase component I family protein [Candidatus Woesearchaeota archaeon]|nr:anthranilate synthase component I family protein [Candidatus Woesearchaeota archaeon]
MKIKENILPLKYEDPFEVYKRVVNTGRHPSLLMESRSGNPAYARNNLVAATQALKLSGKNEHFKIEALSEVGRAMLRYFSKEDFPYAANVKITENSIEGIVERTFDPNLTEFERIRQPNISYAIRTVLSKFKDIQYGFAGLYGAFTYDFARNFENFGDRFSKGGSDDFKLFLPSNILHFDGKKESAEHFQLEIDGKKDRLFSAAIMDFKPLPFVEYEDMSFNEYGDLVKIIVDEIKNGRLMQCVISRSYGVSLQRHPLESYAELRIINPSPYCYFFDFADDEYLYGASPELHIKVDGAKIEIRPIAGTIKRGANALEDFHARQKLITDPKELAEHSMLVDLARNDIYRLALHNTVAVTDFGTIETYPNLYHLVSGVTGQLRPGVDSIDALLTTLPAGTLSGAPKKEAMKMIEELEHSRRNYYGGAVGYLCFNGNCNTGITIRSIHVITGSSYVRTGGGIVLLSNPQNEIDEIKKKSEKGIAVLGGKRK